MSDLNQMVTVVNRTSKMLHGTYDGRPYDLPPGESRYTKREALFFRFQNPVMGRGTPLEDWNVRSEYLIGIKELGDDCTPIEQTDALQRWNVEDLNGPGYQVVRPRGGGGVSEKRSSLPVNESGVGFGPNK